MKGNGAGWAGLGWVGGQPWPGLARGAWQLRPLSHKPATSLPPPTNTMPRPAAPYPCPAVQRAHHQCQQHLPRRLPGVGQPAGGARVRAGGPPGLLAEQAGAQHVRVGGRANAVPARLADLPAFRACSVNCSACMCLLLLFCAACQGMLLIGLSCLCTCVLAAFPCGINCLCVALVCSVIHATAAHVVPVTTHTLPTRPLSPPQPTPVVPPHGPPWAGGPSRWLPSCTRRGTQQWCTALTREQPPPRQGGAVWVQGKGAKGVAANRAQLG